MGCYDGIMVRMQIQFTEEQAGALRSAAAEQGTSIAAVTRQAVDRLLVENGNVTSAQARAEVLEIMGKFQGDETDVARNHDHYLAEAAAERG